MFNLVAINLPDSGGKYSTKCHKAKCGNDARYQIFANIDESGLPDWEGKPICSHHLVEETRHRPEIVLSLIDMLIDTLEQHRLFQAVHPPESAGARQVLAFPQK
ncbi:MAG: hypothetical protein P4M01_11310 [Acidobacteriota bacterium]|nr:hypothetical protein [Acidobacteriota bacterium]